jgi:NADH-quinone oxidoreductase subunit C
MVECQALYDQIQEKFGYAILDHTLALNELTIEVNISSFLNICYQLRDDPKLQFEMLVDICGVDYLNYGISDWCTEDATANGFSRGVSPIEQGIGEQAVVPDDKLAQDEPNAVQPHPIKWKKPRFAVVYHFLSLTHNHRLRMRIYPPEDTLIVPSVISVWSAANWFERETFDLFGILFDGHPDLRRILTDYGFIGHPFRKDFPLIGNVEMRYSAKDRRVIYQPVSIPPRTLVPKTIRDDNRYLGEAPNA